MTIDVYQRMFNESTIRLRFTYAKGNEAMHSVELIESVTGYFKGSGISVLFNGNRIAVEGATDALSVEGLIRAVIWLSRRPEIDELVPEVRGELRILRGSDR